MGTRRDTLKALALLAGTAAPWAAPSAWAQAFPSKPVRITTPFPAGSGPDAALRLVAERLTKKWGQAVIIDNKPGGNGFIAISAFKQGATDGYDLIQLDSNHITTHPHTFSKLPYDVERDLAPLRMLLRTPFFVAVGADSPYKTLDELIAAAQARPGKIAYGSWFNGSPGHIGALRLQAMKGVQMLHVPYRDFGQLYAGVASGEVDWALASVASAGALERAGKLRFIALAAPKREPAYPNVPATAESPSTRGYEVSAWAGLFAPHSVAPLVRERIAADVAEALAAPEVVERYRTLGYEAPDLRPAAFAELIQRETRSWGETIRTAGLRLD
jgi:tripartite-type tricarboxylate transporter receptor subunit TctC